MKSFVWILLFLLGLTGVFAPLVYLYTSSQLPQLETEFDLEKLLRLSVEGERMSMRFGQYGATREGITYQRPDFTRLPKDFVALYLVQMGCPGYFQSRREEGLAWGVRLMLGLVGQSRSGDGRCERFLSMRLAEAVGVDGTLGRTVAAHRIHGFLQKDQLIAYELSALKFERAVVGVEDAARVLFRKELEDLELAELAELALTLPGVSNLWHSVKLCQNAALIRQNRDVLLALLAQNSLVPPDRAKNAQARPVSCLDTP